jgi:hypothetical protein
LTPGEVVEAVDHITNVERILNGRKREFEIIDKKEIVEMMRDLGHKVPEWPTN